MEKKPMMFGGTWICPHCQFRCPSSLQGDVSLHLKNEHGIKPEPRKSSPRHTTHFDDCGCKTERLEKLLNAWKDLALLLESSLDDDGGILFIKFDKVNEVVAAREVLRDLGETTPNMEPSSPESKPTLPPIRNVLEGWFRSFDDWFKGRK